MEGAEHLNAEPPCPATPEEGGAGSAYSPGRFSPALPGRGGANAGPALIELAVAHFCSNQAVGFATVLPEVPSPKTPSLPRVWNHPSVSVFQ